MRVFFPVAATLAIIISGPAGAEIIGGTNVTLTPAGFTFGVTPGAQFTLTYTPQGFFDTVSGSTSGTAQFTSNSIFGPTVIDTFFPRNPMTFGPNSLGAYSAFPTLTLIQGSATPTDIGLRYSVGADTFYGYARFTDTNLTSYGFNSVANASITAGAPIDRVIGSAVPEPASWAMFIAGFGLFGGVMRRRRVNVRFA